MAEQERIKLLNKKIRPDITREELRHLITGLNLIGRVTGVIGPWVIRYNRYGKMIISRRPKDFHASESVKAVKRRSNFAAAVRFALFLNNISAIKEIWSKARIKGTSGFNRMIKYNSNYFVDCHPSSKNLFLPDVFQFSFDASISLSEETIRVKGKNLDKNSDEVVILLSAYNPVDANSEQFEMIYISSAASSDIEIKLSNEQLDICKKYKNYILYSALIRKTENAFSWSNVLVNEGETKVLLNKGDDSDIIILFILLLTISNQMIRPLIIPGQKDDYRRALFKRSR